MTKVAPDTQRLSWLIGYSPGMVDTDMGRAAAVQFGRKIEDLGAISETTSVEGILAVVDKATKETHGGKFWSYDGTELTY